MEPMNIFQVIFLFIMIYYGFFHILQFLTYINGKTGSFWGISWSLYKLGVYSIPAGETIRLKVELHSQSVQNAGLSKGSATVHKIDNLKLSRSVVLAKDEALCRKCLADKFKLLRPKLNYIKLFKYNP